MPLAPPNTAMIKSGETEEYELTYRPINAVDFYTRTGYHGDIKKKYSLSTKFIKRADGKELIDRTLHFEFSSHGYQKYLTKAREKNIKIFDFDFNAEEFAKKQEAYLRSFFPHDSAQYEIFAITPAITVNRLITNFRTFKEGDTVVVDIRMLNQSPKKFDVVAEQCLVKHFSKVISPCAIYSDSFVDGVVDSVYALKPGTRLHLNLKYYIDKDLDQWRLSADWLMMQVPGSNNRSPVTKFLYSDIAFIESPITKQKI